MSGHRRRRRASRLSFLTTATIAGSALGLAAPALVKGASLVLEAKAGSASVQSTQSIAIRGKDAFRAIERESDGAIRIQLFTDDVLGNVDSQLVQLRAGAIQFYFTTGTNLASVVPSLGIEGVGFLFKNYRELFSAYDGNLGRRLRADLTTSGLIPVGRSLAGGPLNVSNSVRPLRTPADLQGLKIRSSNARSVRELFAALGASPAAVSPSEMYGALQTHLVDGGSNTLEGMEGQHFYEVQKYLTISQHVWANYFFLANADVWRNVPDKLKDVIARNIDKCAGLQRRDDETLQATLAKTLGQQGMSVNTIDANVFRSRLGQYYANQKAAFGADLWAFVEPLVGSAG